MSTDAERLAAAFAGDGPVAHLDALPKTVDEGYALQDAVRAALGAPIIGWKLAQTVPKAQAAAGITAPTVSPFIAGMVVPSDTVFPAKQFYKPEIEAEVAFEIGVEIDKPTRKEDLIDHISAWYPAIEVADTRYADKRSMGTPAVIGDMNSCGALILGPKCDLNDVLSAVAAPAHARLGDGTIVPNLPDDMRPNPLDVLAFLSQFATARGHVIAAGAIVTTGTHTAPTKSGPGAISAQFLDAMLVSGRLGDPRW